MKIAVASIDGETVSATLADAEGVAVFEATDNEVEFLELRRRGSGEWRQAEVSPDSVKGRTSVPPDAAIQPIGESVQEDLLREILDCAVVVAGKISPIEEAQLQRLGLLALPVFAGEQVELAVRFVVSGAPLGPGQGCGHCRKGVAAG